MDEILHVQRPGGNTPEPEMLIIHCPRVVQVSRWDDWAQWVYLYLKSLGWIERREWNAVHMISPVHPAMGTT